MTKAHTPMVLWESPPQYAQEAQCNCACSVANIASLTLDNKQNHHLPWQVSSGLYTTSLPQEHTLLFNPLGMTGPVVVNEPARTILENFSTPTPLTTTTAEQLAALGILQRSDTRQTRPESKSTALTAWLHVTNECNLRCVYCYINKTSEAMSAETGLAAIGAIFRTAQGQGFETVKLKYAGGEATLNFRLIRELHDYAQEWSTRTGLALQEVVLSNGVALTNGILDFIRDNAIQLSISLDGSAVEHDSQRVFINGKGSYHQVRKGIERALARGVQPHLSITVTGQSVDGLVDAVQFAIDHDLLFNLNFYRDHDSNKTHDQLRADDDRLIAAMRAVFAVIEERLPRRTLISALVDRANFAGPHQHSCGAGHDYMVIDHAGRVGRCQMEMDRPVTDVYAANPLANIRLYDEGFQNVKVDEKEGCRDCQWRYWCAGGCSLLTYRVTGRSDVKSPYCNVYKTLYPEMLRLEGLRLMKWQTA